MRTPPVISGQDRKSALLEVLRRRIITMELEPGAVLDEVLLAEEFGLSRPPVRELMRQMAAEGYIELETNRAARVASMSYHALRNFFLAAPLVYVATARLAAINRTADDVEELKRIQKRFCSAVASGDIDARVFCNDQFHFCIGKMARNPYLMPSLGRLQIDHARLAKTFYQPHNNRMESELAEAVAQHDQLIAAIAKGDADTAGEIVREHLDLSRRNMAMYVAPDGIDAPMPSA